MTTHDFSSSLMLAGMDYIAPSAACTLPTKLRTGAVQRHAAVKITLQDCLACSGCVTSAEAVLVSSQSRAEVVLARAAAPDRPFLVTVSDQSVSSLAAHWRRPARRVWRVVSGFLRAVFGAQFVSDLRWAQRVSAERTAAEYGRRLRHARAELPMIVSACPGWVCYCEKQGAALLPLLCPVMSPQGVAGSYAKARDPRVCHISVQPCFDRKLEAARDAAATGERYTDFVLSTQELLEWMLETDPALPWDAPLDSGLEPLHAQPRAEDGRAVALVMEGSGGYHRCAMQYAAREIHHTTLEVDDIHYEVKRNVNHQVATSPANPNEVYCVAYGFQHIQNIVRGLKRKSASLANYTFIELMACPDGCLNGGGQIRRGGAANHMETLAEVRSAFGDCVFPDLKEVSTTGGETKAMKTELGRVMVNDDNGGDDQNMDEGQQPFLFSLQAFYDLEKSTGDSLWKCVFQDRHKEFEATLNNGGVHSLKW